MDVYHVKVNRLSRGKSIGKKIMITIEYVLCHQGRQKLYAFDNNICIQYG